MFEEMFDKFNDRSTVFDNNSSQDREKRIQKRKKYLRYAICSLFGFSLGVICDNLLEILFLLFLFCSYILCTD